MKQDTLSIFRKRKETLFYYRHLNRWLSVAFSLNKQFPRFTCEAKMWKQYYEQPALRFATFWYSARLEFFGRHYVKYFKASLTQSRLPIVLFMGYLQKPKWMFVIVVVSSSCFVQN